MDQHNPFAATELPAAWTKFAATVLAMDRGLARANTPIVLASTLSGWMDPPFAQHWAAKSEAILASLAVLFLEAYKVTAVDSILVFEGPGLEVSDWKLSMNQSWVFSLAWHKDLVGLSLPLKSI